MPGGVPFEYNKPTVDEIMAQTSPDNTSVYIGGVPPGATGFYFAVICGLFASKNYSGSISFLNTTNFIIFRKIVLLVKWVSFVYMRPGSNPLGTNHILLQNLQCI